MSAPQEYYKKVIEIMCLRQIVHDARLCREANISYVDNRDLDTASLADLQEIHKALMDNMIDAVFDADGLPSVQILRIRVGRALNGRFVSLRQSRDPVSLPEWELLPFTFRNEVC